jgi:hypothetical protein
LFAKDARRTVRQNYAAIMKFLADRIHQMEARHRVTLPDNNLLNSRRKSNFDGEPIALEIQILQAANALIEAQAEWLLQKLMSDLSFARTELSNGAIEEVSRCAARAATFMKNSTRDFESSEFSSILECADRIFCGMDFEPSKKYTDAFRELRCKALADLRQIYSRHNLEFSI